jgi:cardiolipin synthase
MAQAAEIGDEAPDRLLTVPNLLSVIRLAGVPLFLWLLLGPKEDGWALVVLIASGVTDWLDGKLARWLNQMSSLGALLDPLADRLYTLAIVVGFAIRDIMPWWVAGVLIGRDVLVTVCLAVLRRAGFGPPEVTYAGKAATFTLMFAFPFMLLAQGSSTAATIARPIAYAFAIWGSVLFVWSGLLYVVQTRSALRGRDL